MKNYDKCCWNCSRLAKCQEYGNICERFRPYMTTRELCDILKITEDTFRRNGAGKYAEMLKKLKIKVIADVTPKSTMYTIYREV